MPISDLAQTLITRIETSLGSPSLEKAVAALHEIEKIGFVALRQAVNTPEDRRHLEEAIMGIYDKFVGPYLPEIIRKNTRDSLLKDLDQELVAEGGN